MYNGRCGLISWLCDDWGAYRFLFFFDEIEGILEGDFCVSGEVRLPLEVIRMQSDIINQIEMKDQLHLQSGSYAKLNEYLTNTKYTHEQLYDYLLACRSELAFSHTFYPSEMVKFSADMIRNYEFPANVDIGLGQQNQYDILKRTEHKIFADVLTLTSQICSLQAQLEKSNAEVSESNRRIDYLHNHFEDLQNEKAQRQHNLMIQIEQINKIKAQNEQITSKIELTKLLDTNLEGLIHQNQLRNLQLKQKIHQMSKQFNKYLPNIAKNTLIAEVQALKIKITQIKSKQGKAADILRQTREEELLRCLSQRKTLQQQLLHQQLQKREFFQLLKQFKANFKKVKQKNKNLKQQMAKRGLSLPQIQKKSSKSIY